MKTIIVDGEEYVLKKEVLKSSTPILLTPALMNKEQVVAIGNARINNKYSVVKIEIKYLEAAIKTLKAFDANNKRIYVGICNGGERSDRPLCVGWLKEGTDEFSGVFIAPIVD